MRKIVLTVFVTSFCFHQILAQNELFHSIEVDYPISLKKVKLYGGIGYGTGLLILSQAWYA